MVKFSSQLKNWTGEFGKAYTNRNIISLNSLDNQYLNLYGTSRTALNKLFLNKFDRDIKILEVGCNIGNQLLHLKKMGFRNLYGIEPQDYAFKIAKQRTQDISIVKGNVFDLPFKDGYFDVVFTSGVLIHINPKDIKKALKEIYRCSRKYIWGFEYYAQSYEEIIYRGKRNLLWKTDFPKIYMQTFRDLKIEKVKFLKYLKDDNVDEMFLLKKTR
jgi:pseudaminic acid biosynthesis-associated methylase